MKVSSELFSTPFTSAIVQTIRENKIPVTLDKLEQKSKVKQTERSSEKIKFFVRDWSTHMEAELLIHRFPIVFRIIGAACMAVQYGACLTRRVLIKHKNKGFFN